MKNIHVISTDKLSRLGKFIDTNNLFLRTYNDIPRGMYDETQKKIFQNYLN